MNKLALVFPGQGSQYQGMGRRHYDNNKIVRQIFEEASDIIGVDMRKICFETSLSNLTQTQNAQPAIFITSYVAFQLFIKEGLEPSLMAGHSLGEITALTCSGAISFSDAIQLVRARGIIMQSVAEQSIGSMVALRGIDLDTAEELCLKYSTNDKIASISNYNSTEQIVISGNKEVVIQIGEEVKKKNGKYTKLNVDAPFHSSLMNNAVEEFRNELKKYTYHDMKWPVVSNVTAKPYASSNDIIYMLTKHLVSPVLWKDTVDYFCENNVNLMVELGPKYVLKNLVRNCTNQIRAFSYDNPEEIPELMSTIEDCIENSDVEFEKHEKLKNLLKDYIEQAIELSNKDYKKRITAVTLCLSSAVCVPNRNYNEEEYKLGVVEQYKKMRRMQAAIEREEREPNRDEIKEAFQILFSIFNAKKVSIDEQELRFEQIINRLS